jgi:uncharacterized membrane protein YjgN (DUF898 family)
MADVITTGQTVAAAPAVGSKFTGGMLGYWGMKILCGIIKFVTLFIATPWAVSMWEGWVANNTTIDGRHVRFDGNGMQLFGKYIIWLLLCIPTFGIYGFWLGVKLRKWVVSHTHIA